MNQGQSAVSDSCLYFDCMLARYGVCSFHAHSGRAGHKIGQRNPSGNKSDNFFYSVGRTRVVVVAI